MATAFTSDTGSNADYQILCQQAKQPKLEPDNHTTSCSFPVTPSASADQLESSFHSPVVNPTTNNQIRPISPQSPFSPTCQSTGPTPAEDLSLSRVEQLLQSHDAHGALSLVNRIIEQNPHLEQAHVLRCKSFVQLGDWQQALLSCQSALLITPHHYELLHLSGKVLLEFHKPADAVVFFTKAIEVKPDHLPSWIARGLTYHHHLDDLARAVSDFHASITLNPTYYKTFFYMGMAMADLGRHSLSIEAFSRSISLNPEHSESYFRRGVIRLQQQELENAVQDFSKVTQLVPGAAEAHYNCALAQHLLKRSTEAISSYQRCLLFQPNYINALRNCAHAQSEIGHHEHALQNYSTALKVCSEENIDDKVIKLDILISRGQVHEKTLNFDKAMQDYTEALSLDDTCIRARTARGLLHLQSQSSDQAIYDLTEAVLREPENARNWNNRGTAYLQQQSYQLALDDFNKAVSIYPGFIKALRNRGKVKYLMQNFASALVDLTAALDNPGDYESYMIRANIHRRQGCIDTALKDLDRALEAPRKRKARQEIADALKWVVDEEESDESGSE